MDDTGDGVEPGRWAKPTVNGELVTLRPFVDDDMSAVAEMLADPEGNDLTATTETFTTEQIEGWYRSRNSQSGRIDVAVVERATGAFAGEVVLSDHDPATNACSFRISLRGPAWFGRGLGTEATRLIIDHGFGPVGLDRITLEVLARNPRARRTYEKIGFHVTAEVAEDGEDWVHMALDRAAFDGTAAG
ncbi:MAG: GNAT family N-acetyltransferase [Actinomycetota bacterium]